MTHKAIIAALCALLVSACAGMINSKEKPVLQETTLPGEHSQLARCLINRLSADSRTFMRIFHFKSRAYPAIAASEVHAYDTRFLPYVYASNSPQNPDGIRDYITHSPEIMHNIQNLIGAEYIYGFAFTLQQTSENTVAIVLKGSSYVGGIAWEYLQQCATGMN
ncbi:MAG: hypothetical protein KF908_10975 [Nitrosomonas sp.]|nr:hypothetical protein [Nitrosomonas sp.]MCW5607660.1 hypothetical protein [Nitrosomonas sp.]